MRVLLVLMLLAIMAGPAAASELKVVARVATVSPEVLARFERETGIHTQLVEVSSHALTVDRLLTVPSGFDVAFLPDHRVAELIAAGLLERILADRLRGFWNIEDPWRSRSFDPRNEYTVPHQWGTTAFAVDTTVHRGDIDTLRLMFEPPPEIAGHMALLDDTDMVQMALLYLGEPRCTTDPLRLDKAVKALVPLVVQSRLVSPREMVASLGQPEIVLGAAWNGDAFRAREGRPSLAYAYPREGNLVWTDVAAVPRNPPNRANALKFLAFILNPENAALESNFNGYANMIRGSELHMSQRVLSAPEMVAPWPGKVGFAPSCDGRAQRRQDEAWSEVKLRARQLTQTTQHPRAVQK